MIDLRMFGPMLAALLLSAIPVAAAGQSGGVSTVQHTHPDHAAIVARMKAREVVYTLPLDALIERADRGDLRAIHWLRGRYDHGIGVPENRAEGAKWTRRLRRLLPAAVAAGDRYALYLQVVERRFDGRWAFEREFAAFLAAAKAGSAEAADRVGDAYYRGVGVRMDKAKALRWYRRGAVAGYCGSILNVADNLAEPGIAAGDVAERVRWYRIAAESHGCSYRANIMLGLIYSEGRGNVARDYGQALHWFTRSAEQGNPLGAIQAGFYHEKGLGTPVNKTEALRWFKRAGTTSVAEARAHLAKWGNKEPE